MVSTTIENAGGMILADGGDVPFQEAYINGGTLDRTGASVVRSCNARLTDVTIAPSGWVDAPSGYGAYLLGTEIVNEGTIRVNDTGTGDSWLDVRANLSLTGNGQILMNGDNSGDVITAFYGHTLTQQADHTIRGFGAIGSSFVNYGTVDADRSGGYLRLHGSAKSNHGLMRASSGGQLWTNCTISNDGGIILADGGDVVMDGGNIIGGTIDRRGTCVARGYNAFLTNATIAPTGWVDISSGYGIYLDGSEIVNNGTIRLNDTGTGDSWLDVRSNLSLTGSGSILMNGDSPNDMIYAYYGHTLTQEADHTIHGKGRIVCPFLNRGAVRADSVSMALRIETGGFSNQGLCEATAGAQLQTNQPPQNYGARKLTGGAWLARSNSAIVLYNAAIDTVDAVVQLDGPNSNLFRDLSSTNALAGLVKVGPHGHFTISNGRNFATAADFLVDSGRLTVGAGSEFRANGRFAQVGCGEDPNLSGTTCVDGILSGATGPIDIQGGRLCGNGIVNGDVANAGCVHPGASAGELTISGSYAQMEAGTCWIELAGPAAGEHDHLRITGNAELAGRLIVQSISGYEPQVGDRFTIMTFGSRTGVFTLETGSPGVGLLYETHYHPDHIEIEITGDPSDVVESNETETDVSVVVPTRETLYARLADNGAAALILELPRAAQVTAELFDFSGRRVARLIDGPEDAGVRTYTWNGLTATGARAASGIYFARARLQSADRGDRVLTARVLLTR